MTQPPDVRASGGVLLRKRRKVRQVLVVHRPAYDDWSLPKGKVDPGEGDEQAAVREIREETGIDARLAVELDPVRYHDRKGRDKQVRYWLMVAGTEHDRMPDDEVDEVRWVDVDEADDLLTYETDRRVLAQARKARRHRTLFVVRHAHAGVRGTGDGDGSRPLSERGHRQADDLVELLAPWHVASITTSPLLRCVQTMTPLGTARDLALIQDKRLVEGASRDHVADLVAETGAGAVVCSHGDVIGDLVRQLVADGVVARGDATWQKGSTWMLRLDKRDRPVSATYLPPSR